MAPVYYCRHGRWSLSPGFQYLQIHGLDASQDPLIWNLGVAHLFHKFASADAVVDLNKRLHELRQRETESLSEYMARAIPLAADSNLSIKERGKLLLQGMSTNAAKNTFLGAWSQTTPKSFDELRDMALQTWVPTAAVMLSDNNVDLSKPPSNGGPRSSYPKVSHVPVKGGEIFAKPLLGGGGRGGNGTPA